MNMRIGKCRLQAAKFHAQPSSLAYHRRFMIKLSIFAQSKGCAVFSIDAGWRSQQSE